MQFSIKQLGMAIAWLAILLGLITLLRIEANQEQWPSRVSSGVLLLANVGLSLFGIITAIAVAAEKRFFWIGFSVVAAVLTLGQLCNVQLPGVSLNAALWIETWIMPKLSDKGQMLRSGYLSQVELLVTYGPTPFLAWLAGWYAQRTAKRHRS